MPECVVAFLKEWAPTLWYMAGLLGFWVGAGVLTFRSAVRAWHSRGFQRVAGQNAKGVQSFAEYEPSADQAVWVYSSLWVLVVAAILGPASIVFALIYCRYLSDT
ncbi:MAG: hypothetical protein OXG43_01580 [Chloroflexi bacterium]|nr:hypothetical protein [Chloroflexota bacterium]